MLSWLAAHQDDVSIGHMRGLMGHIEVLSDKWTADEFSAIMARTAWGDHITLGALCGVLRELHGVHAAANVLHLSGQIDYVTEPNVGVVHCDFVLELAYTGNHYLSIIELARPPECASRAGTPCQQSRPLI